MIGVCIKYFHENYGGMLQAFATVKMLESRGIDYELIRYKKKLTITEMIRFVPRLLNGVLLNDKYEAFLKRQGMKKHPELWFRRIMIRQSPWPAPSKIKWWN